MAHIVLAQLEVDGCTAELYLNDVPLLRLTPDLIPVTNIAVEEWLVPGANRLEVLVDPGAHPTVARSDLRRLPFRPIRATARLLRFEDGASGFADDGELLGEVTYSWTQTPPDERDFPGSLTTDVNLGPAHGAWRWQSAPVLSQGEALTQEARAILDQVADAFTRRDGDRLWRLVEKKREDALKAYPALTAGMMRVELEGLLAELGPDPVAPRDPDEHDFRLAAGGRLLELIDWDWKASLGVRDPQRGMRQPFRMWLARLDGALRVVR